MDIDIDLKTDFDPTKIFDNIVAASMVDKQTETLKKHLVGYYFQNIPKDKLTGLAAIPYTHAEDLGYIKIDFLHLSVLNYFSDKKEIKVLLSKEPDWNLLLQQEVVEKLFQLHRHYDVVYQVKPKNVLEVADTIALIRPGKRKLLPYYIKDKEMVRQFLYIKPEDGKYYFKKSHAVAYALTIKLLLHLIEYGIY
jgi:DNA polymerase III alpha subunit